MMDSQVESRLYYDLQTKANSTLLVLEHELRDLRGFTVLNDSMLAFASTLDDTVSIYRDDQNLLVLKKRPDTGLADTTVYPLQLQSLSFQWTGSPAGMLRVAVETVSRPEQEVGNRPVRYRAFAEKDFNLMNLSP